MPAKYKDTAKPFFMLFTRGVENRTDSFVTLKEWKCAQIAFHMFSRHKVLINVLKQDLCCISECWNLIMSLLLIFSTLNIFTCLDDNTYLFIFIRTQLFGEFIDIK